MTDMPSFNVAATANDWRGVALSNFCLSPFVLGGTLFASIEGFIQGTKFPEGDPRRGQAFASHGWEAKAFSDLADRSGPYWNGAVLAFGSARHHQLIGYAIRARILQSPGLQQALISTRGMTIVHEVAGQTESPKTSLPAHVFCAILSDLRAELSGEATAP